MSNIDAGSSDMSGSLTLSSDDGTNSDVRSMSLKTYFIVNGMGDSISLLVGSRNDAFDWIVTINKGICSLIILITKSSSPSKK